MSDAARGTGDPSGPLPPSPRRHGPTWIRWVLGLCLVGGIVYIVDQSIWTLHARENKDDAEVQTVRVMGLIEPTTKGLSSKFTDTQQRMLADPPKSADQLVNPDPLVLAHIETSDPEDPVFPWEQFETHLAKVTGKPVVDRSFENSPEDLTAIEKHGLTVVALHAADAPFLVNHYGYQPLAVVGDDSGANGNHLDVLVAPDSTITRLSDLRGKSLVCSVPSSITGYRAAVTLLMANEGLRPNVDYFVLWSLGQKKSIQGIARKEYAVAAVSDDKLQAMLAKGDISPSDYRVIYQSAVVPRTTIGTFYNLDPTLAAKIREAVLSFQPDKPAIQSADADTPAKPLHFIPIEYKKDFQLVRLMDDRFDPRMGVKLKLTDRGAAAPTSQPNASEPQ
jgi:phosphonate transport system substrate-binding protein